MIEIEQKYTNADHPALAARLVSLGASPPETHVEVDCYYNAPDRDFARTGEAFRLRRVGARNFLTYKGPRESGEVKIRRELEPALPDGDEVARQYDELLQALGFRPVLTIAKTRRSCALRVENLDVTVCLDDAEGLGPFAEIEVLSGPTDAEKATARDVLERLARTLGLTQVEPRSYLTMHLQARASRLSEKSGPVIVRTLAELEAALAEARRQRHTIGLVPTMGALHEGHLSLVRASRSRDGFTVVTIFVNPTQFGPREDLTRYPRPFEDDVRLCAEAGVDLIFQPEPATIYPENFCTYVEVHGLQDVLEGAARPGHFRGVATVVLKLFNLVRPDRAYFGQKDAQQLRIIRQMVRDLNVPVDVVPCPTQREPNGLAMSSRNRYLDPQQHARAAILHQALRLAEALFRSGCRDGAELRQAMLMRLAEVPEAVVDYAVVVDAETLQPPQRVERPALLALAVRFGTTRLIDNLLLNA